MTKRLIIDVLMSSCLMAVVLIVALFATRTENRRIKRECVALFSAAPTAHDSLTVLVSVPNCRTLLQER